MARHQDTTAKIHAGACYFAFVSRDINAIAGQFDVDTRTIRRWADDPEWDAALDACLYTGDRKFEVLPFRDTQRDNAAVFETAREAYIQAIRAGEPQHRWATIAGEKVGVPRRRIHTWAMKYNWRDTDA